MEDGGVAPTALAAELHWGAPLAWGANTTIHHHQCSRPLRRLMTLPSTMTPGRFFTTLRQRKRGSGGGLGRHNTETIHTIITIWKMGWPKARGCCRVL